MISERGTPERVLVSVLAQNNPSSPKKVKKIKKKLPLKH
jgi:hypothetical protein